MGLKILLADPSEEWLDTAGQFFSTHFYEVEKAHIGKRAQLALFNGDFFAVVLNINIKDHSGAQVLKYIKSTLPGLKIILLADRESDFENQGLSRKILEKQGVQDIHVAPYTLEQVKMSLEGQTEVSILLSHAPERNGQSNEVEVQLEDSRFTSIKIEDFISSKAVQFDLYVKLKPGHYVKILHAGDSFSQDRINKYKFEKNVKFLYFTVEDRKKFIRVQNFLAEKTATNQKIEVTTKGRVLKNVGEKLVEEIFYEGVRPQVLDQGKALCNSIYEMVNSGQNLAAMLREYQDFDPTAYSHSYLVCLFSCSLVKQFEWESKIVNETIGMAALLHDIGKLKMHKSLIALRPEDMTPEEVTQYKNHPQLGFELLANQTMVTAAVKQIVLQHHERNDGSGFPYGIKRKKILTLAKMIGLIDEFVHIMVKDKIPPPKALKQLLMGKDSVERFSSGILENFIRIFVDPDKLE